MEEIQKTFSTRDLYLAAAIFTEKFDLVDIEYQYEGTKQYPVGYFKFELTPELAEFEKKYWLGEVLMEPRTLMSNVWNLKSRVVNTQKNPTDGNKGYKRI